MTHVLIVDDSHMIRLLLRYMLEKEGYIIYAETNNGDDALALLRASPHRLIVTTDHAHVGLSGDKLLRYVVQDPILSTRHVYLLISANDDVGRNSEALRQLDSTYIEKPFKPAVIVEEMERMARRLEAPSRSTSIAQPL
jgi:CheY-like chemotaxis protein